jgi:Cu-Zn family superoxide dismutase
MPNTNPIKAIAVFNNSNLSGYVTFTEDNKNNKIIINVNLTGLTPGKHGIHIHEAGNLLDECKSCCAHFNPDNTNHGGQNNNKNDRHIGDLGNIKVNNKGECKITFSDNLIKLRGYKYNIIGRSLVIHQDEDDLGLGIGEKKDDSLKTGNSGSRIGCSVIGYAEAYYF